MLIAVFLVHHVTHLVGLCIACSLHSSYLHFSASVAYSSGCTNDYIAFDLSELRDTISRLPPGFWVAGDPAYPLMDNLLTPFPGVSADHNVDGKDDFNFFHSQLRYEFSQTSCCMRFVVLIVSLFYFQYHY